MNYLTEKNELLLVFHFAGCAQSKWTQSWQLFPPVKYNPVISGYHGGLTLFVATFKLIGATGWNSWSHDGLKAEIRHLRLQPVQRIQSSWMSSSCVQLQQMLPGTIGKRQTSESFLRTLILTWFLKLEFYITVIERTCLWTSVKELVC